eukprot:gnl/Spiro4/16189_TR8705_c0_g1_i1.p2 gnl/Spiro4/16189_TR8705_c0_g1~~gnl/Spiro4/16189_TR8705_c0_g1_i1.p2  ORF type:complete len:215 (-),score=52.10 gnl/Spiro4/16189_TR8705_c0_g1_i1:443-1087(-)
MSFNINEFLSVVGEKGFLKANKFRVFLPVPKGLRNATNFTNYTATSADFQYWCEGAAVPASTLQLHQVQRYGYGQTNRKPFNQVNQDMPLTLLADAEGDNWNFLMDWTNLISSWSRSQGFRTSGANATYEIAYKADYVVDATIEVFNDIGDVVKTITLIDAYPSMIGELRMDWQDNNNIQRLPVTLTFFDWFKEEDEPSATAPPSIATPTNGNN